MYFNSKPRRPSDPRVVILYVIGAIVVITAIASCILSRIGG